MLGEGDIPGFEEQGKRASHLAHLITALCAFVGAGVLIVFHITRNGLWIDELYTLHAIKLPLREMVLERLTRGHFPLYFLLVRWIVEFPFGGQASELSLRSLSFAFWVLSLGSFWMLATRFLSRPVAMLAITLLALNGLAGRQAVDARMYTVVLFIAIWIMRAYLELLTGAPAQKWKIILVGAMVMGFWTSGSMFMLTFPLLIHAFLNRDASRHLLKVLLLAFAIVVLSLLPGVLFHLGVRRRTEIAGADPLELFAHIIAVTTGVYARSDYFDGAQWLEWLRIPAGVFVAVLLGKAGNAWKHLPKSISTCGFVLLSALSMMLVTWILEEITDKSVSLLGPARYLMAVLPAGLLLTAHLMSIAISRPRFLIITHVSVTCILGVALYGLLTVQVEPFRRLARMLGERANPGDAVVVVPEKIADGVEMYNPGLKVDLAVDRWLEDEKELAEKLEPFRSRSNVWIVWYRGRESRVVEVAEQLFGPAVGSNPRKKYGTLRLFHLTPGSGDIPTSSTALLQASES